MAELTRRSNVAPFAAIHSNTEEAQISGYKYDSCLHQSKHMWLGGWPNPSKIEQYWDCIFLTFIPI